MAIDTNFCPGCDGLQPKLTLTSRHQFENRVVLDGLGQGLNRYRDEIIQSRPLYHQSRRGLRRDGSRLVRGLGQHRSPVFVSDVDSGNRWRTRCRLYRHYGQFCSSPHYARVPSAAPLLASRANGLQRFFWYPLAIASALAALWVRQSIDPAQGSQPGLILFLLPIALSAYLGGLGPGLLATGTTAVLSNYFLLFPRLSLTIDSSLAFAQWIALIAIGSLLSIVFETLRRARAQAQNIGALQSAIVASSQDAIYSATPAGMIMSWNEAAEKTFWLYRI